MKVGILTFHRAYNYGAYLQACALCNRLNLEDGIEAEIIDYRMMREENKYALRKYPLRRKIHRLYMGTYFFEKTLEKCFIKALDNPVMRKSKDSMTSDCLEDFSRFIGHKYDVIVAGSDEIWKVDNFRGFPTPYWLFGNLNCRKMAYAASSRVSIKDILTVNEYEMAKKALDDFEFIGVRDQLTYNEIKKMLGNDNRIHMCCDPSFLYDFNKYDCNVIESISRKKGFDRKKKTIMVMIDDNNSSKLIKKQLLGYNLVSVYKPHKGYINISKLEPLEWLCLIKHVDFIISSFYHAICFSIINNKPFLAIGTKNKKSKLSELLSDPIFKDRYLEIQSNADFPSRIAMIVNSDNDFSRFVLEKQSSFDVFLTELFKE